MSEALEELETSNVPNIMDKAVLLLIKKTYIGVSKTVRPEQIQVIKWNESQTETDKSWMSTSKTIFSSKKLWSIYNADSLMEINLVKRYCLPSPLRSAKLLPVSLVPKVDEVLENHLKNRIEMVNEFCSPDEYQSAIDRAKLKLGPLFNPDDYMPLELAKREFRFSWQYAELGVGNALRSLSAEVVKREEAMLRAQWVDASNNIRTLLRVNMNDLVSHLIDRLSPTTDGKRKAFKRPSIDNINDFISVFDARNLTSDVELKAMVDKISQMTKGLDPELLRGDDNLRDIVKQGFEEIKVELDKLVVDAPRLISFEDE